MIAEAWDAGGAYLDAHEALDALLTAAGETVSRLGEIEAGEGVRYTGALL